MAASAPLQVLIFRHSEDVSTALYEEQIVRAFKGGKEAGGYLATGEDLKIELKSFTDVPPQAAVELIDAFCHSLTIVLIDRKLLESDAMCGWLAAAWARIRNSGKRHAMIPFPMQEDIGWQFAGKPGLDTLQVQPVQTLGELAIRPTMAALRVLHEARVLLTRALPGLAAISGQPAGFLRLFISHAKADGLPLAQAIKHQIQSIPWLKTFYDAEDLPPGSDWQLELENGVGSSLIIMLRTEAYDGRYWCEKEVRWADEYATPAVLVEARTALNHPASALPLGRIPTVRIPDGNLMRVLFGALREGLRFLIFARWVEEMKKSLPNPIELRVFCFHPGMNALLRACRSLAASTSPSTTPRMILYPDPVLGSGELEAAQALVSASAPDARLVTPQTLAAQGSVA